MPDDVVELPGTGADVAVDDVSGVEYQLIKLVDATEDSTTRTGVPDHPFTTEARMAFVDYDDSIVPVTDNADNHWLPVAIRSSADLAIGAFNTTAPVISSPSDYALTGPSNGTWGTDLQAVGRTGTLRLSVASTGGTPTIAAYGASAAGGSGGTYDQQLPLVVPNGDSLVLAETFTPGVAARFCYILAVAPYIEIRATTGGTGTAVDATLTFDSLPSPLIATVSSGGASGDTELTTKDYDTGGGTDTQAVVGILLPKSGGAVAGGTSTDPLRTDPTGTTAQPVTDNGGSLTVDNGGTFAVQADTELTTADLDTGAGTDTRAVVGLVGSKSGGAALIPGDATKGLAVDLTATGANATALKVDGSAVTQPVSGTVTVASARAEDAAHNSGDTGAFILSVRQSEANSLTSTAGSDGDYAAVNSDGRGLLQVVARPYVVRQRQASSGLTTSVTAYSIGDTAGAIMTFTFGSRLSGGTGTLLSAVLLDKGDVGTDYRLHIYRSSVTLASDNSAWAVSDSDQQELIGILTMPSMLDVGANRVSTLANIGLPYDCNATSLFVGIETRTANAVYTAATDLNLILTYALD